MTHDNIVTVSKTVDLEIDVRVYAVTCDCGITLDHKTTVDRDGDLNIEVEAHKCEEGQ